MAVLYAATELTTAWSEYNQGFVQHPGLVVRLRLVGATLADVNDDATRERFGIPAEPAEAWRREMADGGEAPTQTAARAMLAAGLDGVRYPSAMSPGGACVALWRWNSAGGPTLMVEDPEGRLPASAASWR